MLRSILVLTFLLPLLRAETPVRAWTARWITARDADSHAYGVYHFRKTIELPSAPDHYLIHISADNRYRLFVNARYVTAGPARGDLFHWRYDSVDIAPFLHASSNAVAVLIWNWGNDAPLNQISAQTGLLVQGENRHELDTGKSWRAIPDAAYSEYPVKPVDVHYQYYVAPPGETLDAERYPWGWESALFDDRSWPDAIAGDRACSVLWMRDDVPGDCHDPRLMYARTIPPMREEPEPFVRIREGSGVSNSAALLNHSGSALVAAHTHARLLLDMNRVTTAYLQTTVSGGAGARLTVRYGESLWIPGTNEKGNRNEVAGKEMRGVRDSFVADGGAHRSWFPLWWRSFRYVELTVETQAEPIYIDDIHALFTAYPFERRAQFSSDGPEWLSKILETGWRTNELSSHETYLDAYYEQLQYVADTRIEALVSLYETGDARLMRNAIEQIDSTRTPDGLTFSRGPSRLYQYTPTFSLLWIGMLHEYWRYVNDAEFVQAMLPGVRNVLEWFERLENADGTLRELPYYNFLDSDVKWDAHALAPYECQLLQGFQWAADLEAAFGNSALAREYRSKATRLTDSLRKRYWDSERKLFADDAAHTRFSQHTNALAVLAGLVTGRQATELIERVLADSQLLPCTIYFRYYLNRALVEAGLGERYLEMLGPWRDLLAKGVTAWPESEAPDARSDCHGWGDHPNIEIYLTVLGIDSAAPGFTRVKIEPHLGFLQYASGVVPLPSGKLSIALRRDHGGLRAEIDSPVPGLFVCDGREYPVRIGRSEIRACQQ